MKILVADDDPTSRLITRAALRELGYECHAVADGAAAWDAFQTLRPDVVISDWMMPGLTGLGLCSKIRADPERGYTYFIMVTGQRARDQVAEGMAAGADDYLVKPLDPDDLRVRLIAAARVTALTRELNDQRIQLEALNLELTGMALRDSLTGLGNRRALDEDLDLLDARVKRYGQRYCIAILDVDHFKAYNDTYGHKAGDQALQTVAAQIKEQARRGDGVYRYGGEEFLCIFNEQSLATAAVATERMRSALQALAIPHGGNPHGMLTLSAGLAMLDPSHLRSLDEVLREADTALYRAKDRGRNQVAYTTLQVA
jgi:diguanylate cyclase (GGDEF)-like protein